MRILLIAYDFPPIASPGALRWKYLTREFVAQGHDVHVLKPSVWSDPETRLDSPDGVTEHITFAGPFQGFVRWLSARPGPAPRVSRLQGIPGKLRQSELNWKGRTLEWVQRMAARFVFPDIRGEWRPWAAYALRRLLGELQPDVVISSHEPATTLQIGLIAAKRGIPWVIDLGDPVCAPYTPSRWRRKARSLEAAACRAAGKVVVTTESAKKLLVKRHELPSEKIIVLTQGFDDWRNASVALDPAPGFYDGELLELFYAGRFYDFRRPHELVAAVMAMDGVRLTIATPEFPAELWPIVAQHPERFRLTGLLHHRRVLQYQSGADVLVSIGNDGLAEQVPGKIYEYLGSGRPVLHLLSSEGDADPAAGAVRATQAGGVVENRSEKIQRELGRLKSLKMAGRLDARDTGANSPSDLHSWRSVARRYAVALENAGGRCDPRATATAG